jgi:NADH-quinone oxidoreductase subunit A
MIDVWALLIYAGMVTILAGGMLGLSYVLGERHKGHATDVPYESGIQPTGSARLRLSVKYYLVAMFFVIFDLEAAFVYLWAVSARQVGWAGYAEVVIFIVLLVAALFYLARIGALDWGSKGRRR